MAATPKTIQVDLGSLSNSVDIRVKSGRFASADEVIQAGLLALEREEAATDAWLTKLADDALADPTPPIPMDEAFRKLRLKHGLKLD